MGFLGLAVKDLSANKGDVGSIPRPGRSPGEENGNPLQDYCLGNPIDRGTWRATVHEGSQRVEHDVTKQQYTVVQLPQSRYKTCPWPSKV